MKLKCLSPLVLVAVFSGSAHAFDVEKTFNKTCAICHVPGVAMAPKVGDEKAWEPRIKQGMDSLVKAVLNGKGAMPAMGMCGQCNEEQISALVEHMLPK